MSNNFCAGPASEVMAPSHRFAPRGSEAKGVQPVPAPPAQGNIMDQKTYEKGLKVRTAVLGEEYVNKSIQGADEFNKPFQELVTEYCWGAVWGRETLPLKTRSMLNLVMIATLNRPHELKLHIRGALRNGVTKDEIREIFMHLAIYAGVPAAVDSFRLAREVFSEDAAKK
jgi:4-carboxymuconolactone decarboxylase